MRSSLNCSSCSRSGSEWIEAPVGTGLTLELLFGRGSVMVDT